MSPLVAFSVVFFAWYGARPWLRERPSTFGAVFLLLLLVILQKPLSAKRIALIAALVVLWVNVHPSALLAPVIVLIWVTRSDPVRSLIAVAAAGIALLVNPHGINGVLNPLHVASVAQMPIFANEEWTRTSFLEFKLFAIWLALLAVALLTSARRFRWIASALTIVFLAALAWRFARNQPLLYIATPLLLAPHLRPVPERFRRLLLVPVGVTALAIVAASDFRTDIDRTKFPVEATAAVRRLGLDGNIMSPYGMGGYLVWSFLPERRVLTDGRNELFVDYQKRVTDSRRNSGLWQRLLDDYDVRIAFVPTGSSPLWVRDPASGARRQVREWEVYFPAGQWEIVAADEAAVVLARRQKKNAGT